jgi:hypothetical protein
MSTIQNLKNFIRHGKQARVVDPPTTNISPVHAQQQKQQGYGISEPNAAYQPQQQQQQHPAVNLADGAYSVGAVGNRNVAAQAGAAAAQAQGKQQKIQAVAREAEIQQIVAEEREKQGKLPRYPGLERYHLVAKMGDGAFSNVYRAKDMQQGGEVAIKVVRKFEMNSNQVCLTGWDERTLFSLFFFFFFPLLTPFVTTMPVTPPTLGFDIGRRSPPSELQKAAENCRGAHTLLRGVINYLALKDCASSATIPRHTTTIRKNHLLTLDISLALKHPQGSPNYAATRSPQHRQAHRLLRITSLLLHCP